MSGEPRSPLTVYAPRGGVDYIANVDGTWYRWPARSGGWARRERLDAAPADRGLPLPPHLARLARMLTQADWPEKEGSEQ